jgi:hypothetical protein
MSGQFPGPTPTPKYLSHYHDLELRIEQIGPHLWGACCLDRGIWSTWTSIGLEPDAAKRDAETTARNRLLDQGRRCDDVPHWQNCSDLPDANWDSRMASLGFRQHDYPGHEGMERFPRRALANFNIEVLPCPLCGSGQLLDQDGDFSELGYVPVKCSECSFTGRRVNLIVLPD